jgi:protein O-GlcNAc transferase
MSTDSEQEGASPAESANRQSLASGGAAPVTTDDALKLHQQGQLEHAKVMYEVILAHDPQHFNALNLLSLIEAKSGRLENALALVDRALAIRPDVAPLLNNRANMLRQLGCLQEALDCFERAHALAPDDVTPQLNRGILLSELGRRDEALAVLNHVLDLQPDHPDALYNRGNLLRDMGQLEDAIADYQRVRRIRPDHDFLLGQLLYTQLRSCDWRDLEADSQALLEAIEAGKRAAVPLQLLTMSDDAALQRRAARIYTSARVLNQGRPSRETLEAQLRPAAPEASLPDRKLRIGYFSADFHHHATAHLVAELLESHDRSKFEVMAFSFGPITQDASQARLRRAVDEFLEVGHLSDLEMVQLAKGRGLDVAIDLKGYTRGARPGIFVERCAPVQVSFLGYPGTLGAGFMDYIFADEIVVPKDERKHYSEKVVYLPGCYQANDSRRPCPEDAPTRAALGLPDTGFVFCCFNNTQKIQPGMFLIWMTLLREVEGSVLWLLADNEAARRHLSETAQANGVDPARLVWAPRVGMMEHLARHRRADLFLDTYPYNAHTTASDALWMNLPVLTLQGTTFPSRVASSLLHALDLDECVCKSVEAYASKALHLAKNSAELATLKVRLGEAPGRMRLFSGRHFASAVEEAYRRMLVRWLQGALPESFSVPATPLMG